MALRYHFVFEDMDVVQGLIEKFPTYADNFRNCPARNRIMNTLMDGSEAEGYGASSAL